MFTSYSFLWQTFFTCDADAESAEPSDECEYHNFIRTYWLRGQYDLKSSCWYISTGWEHILLILFDEQKIKFDGCQISIHFAAYNK